MSLKNLTNKTNFLLKIPNFGSLNTFVMQVVSTETPEFRIPNVEIPTGPRGHGRAFISGSTFEHEPINVKILVDRNLDSYVEIYKWMLTISNYLSNINTAQEEGLSPTSIQLHILDNIKTNIVATFNLIDPYPSSLGSLEYAYDEEGDMSIYCNVTFNFKRVELEKDGKIIIG